MKILIVHNTYKIPGGEDTVVKQDIDMLREQGNIVLEYRRNNKELDTGIVKKICLLISCVFSIKSYYDIRRIIRMEKIDIVHVHNTLFLITPAVFYAAKREKVPVVHTLHNYRLFCPNGILYHKGHVCHECVHKRMFAAVKNSCYRDSRIESLILCLILFLHRKTGIYKKIFYICVSDFVKDKIIELNKIKPIIKNEHIYVKHNAFDIERVVANPKSSHEPNRFLFVGRIEESKGIEMLLETFALMPTMELRIAGSGSNESVIKKYADKKNIMFLGRLSLEELGNEYMSAKAVVIPSKWYETFGMVVLEAYSYGTPVIVSNRGNLPYLVEEGITGEVVYDMTKESIAQAICKCYQQEYDHTYIREYAKKLCATDDAKKLVEIYKKIISESGID